MESVGRDMCDGCMQGEVGLRAAADCGQKARRGDKAGGNERGEAAKLGAGVTLKQ